MGTARLHVATWQDGAQVRLTSPAASLIRSRIVERRAELEDHDRDAVTLAAEVLAAMHAAAWGRMSDLRDSRTARYRESQLAGEHGLPLEDVAALAVEGGADVVLAGVEVLLAAIGYRVERIGGGVS